MTDELPRTRYARNGDIHIAYQVVGEGPPDLVFTPGMWSNVELQWEAPPMAHFLNRLASFTRLIVFDPRGGGLSDPGSGTDLLEERMDDLRAVMDACGSERAAVAGASWGGPLALLFAATYPDRTSALVLLETFAKLDRSLPFLGREGWDPDAIAEVIRTGWADGVFWDALAPSLAHSDRARAMWAQFQRRSVSPSSAAAQARAIMSLDLLPVLPAVRTPTLILHRRDDMSIDVAYARRMAEGIPDSKLVEVEGRDGAYWIGDVTPFLEEIEEFLTGERRWHEPDRVLATVLFTDIEGSTERAARVGDRRWRGLLEEHNQIVRRELRRFRGREIHTAGDGFLATFDGPARAMRCAGAIVDAVRALKLEVRAGVHTGELELVGQDVRGIAVHIGARVAAMAGPGEVLASGTVKDLVAGSGLEFEDRGVHALKGVPGEWRVFAVKN